MIKVVLGTFLATCAAIALGATLFLNSALGLFGLVSTSLVNLDNLRESKQIVNRIKQRHRVRKANVSRRFVKKSSRKAASTALAASTIGTVAVVLTVTSLEVMDYCDEKRELLEEENILFGTHRKFDYDSCLQEGREESKKIMESVRSDVSIAVKETWRDTKKYSNEKWDEIRRSTLDALDSTAASAGDLWDSLREWINN